MEQEHIDGNKQRLFVDMDGTLAVFTPVDQLETLYQEGYFRNLKPHKNVVESVKYIINNHPEIEVHILSAYLTDSKYALQEKNEWLDENLPEIDQEHRIFGPCGSDKKEWIPGGIRETDHLLDDYTKNLNDWEPPARGIKLLNSINHTRGSWQHDRIRYDRTPESLAEGIVGIMQDRQHIFDERFTPYTDLKIQNQVISYYSGQMNAELAAVGPDGEVFGYIKYAEYQEEPYIQFIEVNENYRRQGIATRLLRELQSLYKDKEIDWGMTTEDGTKLKEAVTYTVENTQAKSRYNLLEETRGKLEANEKRLNELYEIETLSPEEEAEIEKLGEAWDALTQSIYDLEQEMGDEKPYRTFIKMEDERSPEQVSKIQIPPITVDPSVLFFEDERPEEYALYQSQREAAEGAWREIILGSNSSFTAAQFDTGGQFSQTLILTKSVREGVDYQLSFFDQNGEATMHEDYYIDNTASPIEIRGNDRQSLFERLANYSLRGREIEVEVHYEEKEREQMDQEKEIVRFQSAVLSNYDGYVALSQFDRNKPWETNDYKLYLGKRENYDSRGNYDNSDNSLVFISGNRKMDSFLNGEGWVLSQQEMIDNGSFTEADYAEYAQLKEGVLKQFEASQIREVKFGIDMDAREQGKESGVPFQYPDWTRPQERQTEMAEREQTVERGIIGQMQVGVASNYEGYIALVQFDPSKPVDKSNYNLYLGKPENYDAQGNYDNSDNSLVFISNNRSMVGFLSGNGWAQTQQEMIGNGTFTVEDYAEYAMLKEGVLKQFEGVQFREARFGIDGNMPGQRPNGGVPFQYPIWENQQFRESEITERDRSFMQDLVQLDFIRGGFQTTILRKPESSNVYIEAQETLRQFTGSEESNYRLVVLTSERLGQGYATHNIAYNHFLTAEQLQEYRENPTSFLESVYADMGNRGVQPADYYGHSLSVGDSIAIITPEGIEGHYVSNVGFQRETVLNPVLTQEQLRTVRLGMTVREEYDLLLRLNEKAVELGDERIINAMQEQTAERLEFLRDEYRPVFNLAAIREVENQERDKLQILEAWEEANDIPNPIAGYADGIYYVNNNAVREAMREENRIVVGSYLPDYDITAGERLRSEINNRFERAAREISENYPHFYRLHASPRSLGDQGQYDFFVQRYERAAGVPGAIPGEIVYIGHSKDAIEVTNHLNAGSDLGDYLTENFGLRRQLGMEPLMGEFTKQMISEQNNELTDERSWRVDRATRAMEAAGFTLDPIETSADRAIFLGDYGARMEFETVHAAEEWLDGVVFDDPEISDAVEKIMHPERFVLDGMTHEDMVQLVFEYETMYNIPATNDFIPEADRMTSWNAEQSVAAVKPFYGENRFPVTEDVIEKRCREILTQESRENIHLAYNAILEARQERMGLEIGGLAGRLQEQAAGDMNRHGDPWGSWFARISHPERPQDYIELDITGYSTRNSVIESATLVLNGNVHEQMEMDEMSFNDYGNEEGFDTGFAGKVAELAQRFDPSRTEEYVLYAPAGWSEHSLDEHYQMLKDRGLDDMPNWDAYSARVREEAAQQEQQEAVPANRIHVAIESTEDYTEPGFHQELVDANIRNEDGSYGKVKDFYRIAAINEEGRVTAFDDRVFESFVEAEAAIAALHGLERIPYDSLVEEAWNTMTRIAQQKQEQEQNEPQLTVLFRDEANDIEAGINADGDLYLSGSRSGYNLPDTIENRHAIERDIERYTGQQVDLVGDMKEPELEEDHGTISFYVAESMEFELLGEYYDGLTLQEAFDIYENIPSERLHGGKGIGFNLQDGSIYSGNFALLLNNEVQDYIINEIDHFRNSPLVQQAVQDFKAEYARRYAPEQTQEQIQQPSSFIAHYYVVEDIQNRGPLNIRRFENLNEALVAYGTLPSDKMKALGIENTNPLPGSLDIVQCRDGVDTIVRDYLAVEGWNNPEIFVAVEQITEGLEEIRDFEPIPNHYYYPELDLDGTADELFVQARNGYIESPEALARVQEILSNPVEQKTEQAFYVGILKEIAEDKGDQPYVFAQMKKDILDGVHPEEVSLREGLTLEVLRDGNDSVVIDLRDYSAEDDASFVGGHSMSQDEFLNLTAQEFNEIVNSVYAHNMAIEERQQQEERFQEPLVDIHDLSYDDEGYLHFMVDADGHQLEGLYRVLDPANGEDMELVSIDYGDRHPIIERQWDRIADALYDESYDRYNEMIDQRFEHKDRLVQAMALAGYVYNEQESTAGRHVFDHERDGRTFVNLREAARWFDVYMMLADHPLEAQMERILTPEQYESPIPAGDEWFYNDPARGDLIGVHYNPDSAAGGQFVQRYISYDMIQRAARESGGSEQRFFEYFDEHTRYTELTDINTVEFKEAAAHYRTNVPDFTRKEGNAMEKLMRTAEQGIEQQEVQQYLQGLVERDVRSHGAVMPETMERMERIGFQYNEETGIVERAAEGKEELINIGVYACEKVDEWTEGNNRYVLGNSVEDKEFYYAIVNDNPAYMFVYDEKPTREQIEGDFVDREAARAIDQHEAEFGADGYRVFPDRERENEERWQSTGEVVFHLDDTHYLHIQSADQDYDYTLFDSEWRLMDGGQIGDLNMTYMEVRNEIFALHDLQPEKIEEVSIEEYERMSFEAEQERRERPMEYSENEALVKLAERIDNFMYDYDHYNYADDVGIDLESRSEHRAHLASALENGEFSPMIDSFRNIIAEEEAALTPNAEVVSQANAILHDLTHLEEYQTNYAAMQQETGEVRDPMVLLASRMDDFAHSANPAEWNAGAWEQDVDVLADNLRNGNVNAASQWIASAERLLVATNDGNRNAALIREARDLAYTLQHLDQFAMYFDVDSGLYSPAKQAGAEIPIEEFKRNGRTLEGDQIPGRHIPANSIGYADRTEIFNAVRDFEDANDLPSNERAIHGGTYEDKEFLYMGYDRHVGQSHVNDLSIQPYMERLLAIANNKDQYASLLPMVAEVYYAQQNGVTHEQIEMIVSDAELRKFPLDSMRNLRHACENGLTNEQIAVLAGEDSFAQELLMGYMAEGGSIENARALKGCDVAQYYILSSHLNEGSFGPEMAQAIIRSGKMVVEWTQADMERQKAELGENGPERPRYRFSSVDTEFFTEYLAAQAMDNENITPEHIEAVTKAFLEQTETNSMRKFVEAKGGMESFVDAHREEVREDSSEDRMVQTNIGPMPIQDYREMIAEQHGFNSYDEMYKAGLRIGNGYDKEPEKTEPQPEAAQEQPKQEQPAQVDEKKDPKELLNDQLQQGILNVLNTENFKNWLDTSSKMFTSNYSFNNAILVWCQRPDATHTMGYEQWKEYGRNVAKGAEGIKIFVPVIAYEKKDGDLWRMIKGKLDAELKASPSLNVASFRVGMSKLEFTKNREGIYGIKVDGKERGMRSEKDMENFIKHSVVGKVPMYFTVGTVFDAKDTITPEFLWMKKGFTKAEMALDEKGKPIKNKRGEYKIINTPERQAKFQPTLDMKVPEKNPENMKLLYEALKAVSERNGIPVYERQRAEDDVLRRGADGYFSRDFSEEHPKGYIVMPKDMEPTKAVSVMLHEMSHSELHGNLEKLAQQMGEKNVPSHMREIQAEAVAYVVGQNFGIETSTSSFNYLAAYSKGFELQALSKSLDVIYKECKQLTNELKSELESRGYNMDLTKREDVAMSKDAVREMSKAYIGYTLEQTDRIAAIEKELPDLAEQNRGKDTVTVVLVAQTGNIKSQKEDIALIQQKVADLENAKTFAEQKGCIEQIEAAKNRVEDCKKEFTELTVHFQEAAKTEQTLKDRFVADPVATIKDMGANMDHVELGALTNAQVQYLAKSDYVARELVPMLRNDAAGFAEKAYERASQIDKVASKNGMFVEVSFCEQWTDKPIVENGALMHPKVADTIVKQAETQIRSLRTKAESMGDYFPYSKCDLTVYQAQKGELTKAYRTRVDIGDGTQGSLADHLKQLSGTKALVQDFEKATREKGAKDKILFNEPPKAEVVVQAEKEAPACDRALTTEQWEEKISEVKAAKEAEAAESRENNREVSDHKKSGNSLGRE